MINISDLKDLLHTKGMYQKDKLLLVLAVNACAPKKAVEIRKIASEAGLKQIHRWNITAILSSVKSYAVSAKNGWELNKTGQNYVDKLLHITPISAKPVAFSHVDFKKTIKDNIQLAELLNSRINEIEKNISVQAHLSAVIIMGSLLEGFLLYLMNKHPKQANQSKVVPKRKDGSIKPINEWKLFEMINIAHDLGWIKNDIKQFSHSLRNYRNLVHPYEQLKENEFPDRGTCDICVSVVNAGISELVKIV